MYVTGFSLHQYRTLDDWGWYYMYSYTLRGFMILLWILCTVCLVYHITFFLWISSSAGRKHNPRFRYLIQVVVVFAYNIHTRRRILSSTLGIQLGYQQRIFVFCRLDVIQPNSKISLFYFRMWKTNVNKNTRLYLYQTRLV